MNQNHTPLPLNILLADDDTDDRFFFAKALMEIPIATHLNVVHDGEQLMNYLAVNTETLPDIIFLDLNMPRKTGFECLSEIKENEKLKHIRVVMFSTSHPANILYEENLIKTLYDIGADDFIRKASGFAETKLVVHKVLSKAVEGK